MLGREDDRAIAAVAAFLDHPSAALRRLAADALGEIARPCDIEIQQFERMLEDESPKVRLAALQAIQTVYGYRPEFIGLAVTMLGDEYVSVRTEAITMLGAMGPAAAATVPEILKAAEKCTACLAAAIIVLPRILRHMPNNPGENQP